MLEDTNSLGAAHMKIVPESERFAYKFEHGLLSTCCTTTAQARTHSGGGVDRNRTIEILKDRQPHAS